jgi:predicted transcriptional regulator
VGVISVRLNKEEEKMLKHLSEYFHADRSTLIKKSLFELYENMLDIETIESFEKKEKRGESLLFQQKRFCGNRSSRSKTPAPETIQLSDARDEPIWAQGT